MDRIKLKTFVALTMDIASASPRRYFFEVMSFFATAEHEKEKLQYFASPEGRDDLYQYNQKESRTVLEVRMFALKIFAPLNKFHAIHALACRTILAIMCLFCPSVAFHG